MHILIEYISLVMQWQHDRLVRAIEAMKLNMIILIKLAGIFQCNPVILKHYHV